DGNCVVSSPNWDNGGATDVGAATFGNGTTGIKGVVSANNSLVGGQLNDRIGFYDENGHFGITALTNGNYVVSSPNWDNSAVADAGAVTFGNGATGISGTVSAANSLIGGKANDNIG